MDPKLLSHVATQLKAEAEFLIQEECELSLPAMRALGRRLDFIATVLTSAEPERHVTPRTSTLTNPEHDVTLTKEDQDVNIRPPANPAIARTQSDAPALRAVLASGWSIRALADQMSKIPFEWNLNRPVKISHNHLGHMLKGTYPMADEVRKAVRQLTKAKI